MQPAPYGPFVQPKGGYDGRNRAAMRQQGEHERHQIMGMAQPVERSVRRGGERVPAPRTAIPLVGTGVDVDVPLADESLVRTGQVRTEYSGRVHPAGSWVRGASTDASSLRDAARLSLSYPLNHALACLYLLWK